VRAVRAALNLLGGLPMLAIMLLIDVLGLCSGAVNLGDADQVSERPDQ
jgi:hypothetical protein